MASEGDDERNDNYAGSRHRNVKQNEAQTEEAVWSEKCIGFWHKDSGRKGSKGQQICTGINIIHINKVEFHLGPLFSIPGATSVRRFNRL